MYIRKRLAIVLYLTLCCTVLSAAAFPGLPKAQCPEPPTTCRLVDSNGATTPYSLSIAPSGGAWPFPFIVENVFKGLAWAYQLSAEPGYSLPSVNQISILAPDCCGILSYSVYGGGSVLQPGLGDPTTMFGVGNFQDYVIRLAYNSSSPYYFFLTDKLAPFQATSLQIKSGKTNYYCKAIAGPSCLKEETIMVTKKRVYNPKRKMWICSDIDPFTGCEKNLTNCTDEENPVPLTPIPLSELYAGTTTTSPLSQIGVDGAKCPTVDLDTTGDHTWYRCSGGWCWY